MDRRLVERMIEHPKINEGLSGEIAADERVREARLKVTRRKKSLSGRLLEAQETERHRIARELHDEIGQSLTAIKIRLQSLLRRSKAGQPDIKECIRIADLVLSQVHSLSLDLRPPQLEDLGLAAALRWHLDRQAHAAKLTPHFSADSLPGRLQPDIEIACFRVAQEALTNVIRHARARQVWVKLRRRGADLHLTVQDDGRGVDADAARDRADQGAKIGLIGMRERAELAGGRLKLISSPGQGMQVHLLLPLAYAVPNTRSKPRKS